MSAGAESRGRMWFALVMLCIIAGLTWVTMDPAQAFLVDGRRVPVRLPVEMLLGLFAFRIVMAHLRSRYDRK